MVAQTKTAEPTIVNGINVDDMFALIEDVRRNPAKGKTNWHVTTTWQGQARSRAQVDGFEIGGKRVPRRFSIDIDEPCEIGGTNRFANPAQVESPPVRQSLCGPSPAPWKGVPVGSKGRLVSGASVGVKVCGFGVQAVSPVQTR